MLRVGRIQYANCTPIFHLLEQLWCDRGVAHELVCGVPAVLNELLSCGRLDVCPSSSFEYARHADRYALLPGISIASKGPVASVLLFARRPIEELAGRTVLLSTESATSVNLLRILLAQRFGIECNFKPQQGAGFDGQSPGDAFLLIGDAALRASFEARDCRVYDLGALWYEWTGLPFVFALWICRAELADSEEMTQLGRDLEQIREAVSDRYPELALHYAGESWLGYDRLLRYWRDNISYALDGPHLRGLELYYRKSYELGLIDRVPSLRFIAP